MPLTWIPTQALITDWKALRNAAVKKQAGQAVQAQAIANGAKTRLDALSDEVPVNQTALNRNTSKHITLARANQQEESIWRVIFYPLSEKESLEKNSRNAKEGSPLF